MSTLAEPLQRLEPASAHRGRAEISSNSKRRRAPLPRRRRPPSFEPAALATGPASRQRKIRAALSFGGVAFGRAAGWQIATARRGPPGTAGTKPGPPPARLVGCGARRVSETGECGAQRRCAALLAHACRKRRTHASAEALRAAAQPPAAPTQPSRAQAPAPIKGGSDASDPPHAGRRASSGAHRQLTANSGWRLKAAGSSQLQQRRVTLAAAAGQHGPPPRRGHPGAVPLLPAICGELVLTCGLQLYSLLIAVNLVKLTDGVQADRRVMQMHRGAADTLTALETLQHTQHTHCSTGGTN